VLIFFIAGLLYLLRFERVDNLGAYRIPPETGLLIPSVNVTCRISKARKGTEEQKSRMMRLGHFPRQAGLIDFFHKPQ
jgi:hypothetical protein